MTKQCICQYVSFQIRNVHVVISWIHCLYGWKNTLNYKCIQLNFIQVDLSCNQFGWCLKTTTVRSHQEVFSSPLKPSHIGCLSHLFSNSASLSYIFLTPAFPVLHFLSPLLLYPPFIFFLFYFLSGNREFSVQFVSSVGLWGFTDWWMAVGVCQLKVGRSTGTKAPASQFVSHRRLTVGTGSSPGLMSFPSNQVRHCIQGYGIVTHSQDMVCVFVTQNIIIMFCPFIFSCSV